MAIHALKPDSLGRQRCLIDWRDGGRSGRRLRRTFYGTREEARAWLSQRQLAPRRRAWGLTVSATVATAAGEFLASKEAAECREGYLRELRRLLAGVSAAWRTLAVEDVGPELVDRWLSHRKSSGAGARTREKDWRMLHTFFRWCSRRGYLQQGLNPVAIVERPRYDEQPPRWLTPAEFAELWKVAPGYLRPLLALLVATGLRSREACELRREDIRAETLYVRARKSRDWLAVPIAPALRELLLAQPARPDGLVFTRPRIYRGRVAASDRWTVSSVFRAIRTAAARAEVLGVGTHTLRHTAASWMVAAGVPIYEVRARLGHSTVAVTERYAHLQLGVDWPKEAKRLPRGVSTFLPHLIATRSNKSQPAATPREARKPHFQRGNAPRARK